ncbi:MAG: SDR family NAD(P)-dependent oxidoreductase [Pseudomonadota bacterium]
MTGFEGRHIVVTGASSGIGLATARLLAARGARVSLIARRQGVLEEAVAAIQAAGGTAACCAADVSDRDSLLGAIDSVEAALGPVDGLFANAGTGGSFAPFTDYDDAVFEAVLRTNLVAPFQAMKRVLPGMIARRRGAILVTGSLASERGMAHNPAYVASKHGLLGLARAAAIEAAPHNVRVNCIIPGFIETPMLDQLGDDAFQAMRRRTPQGRTGTADELAEVAAFLLSDAAGHVTAQSWAVDGGILNTISVGG